MQDEIRHGGAYDRGSADYYYHRAYSPHYYAKDTGTSERITDLTESEIRSYAKGWNDAESAGDQKDWG